MRLSASATTLRAALEALIEPTRREKGYINYDLHQGDEDPEAFFFYENWESGGHLAAPHLQEFAARIPEPLDQNGLTVNRVRSFA
jgi:quinol monooxygenase YgiN